MNSSIRKYSILNTPQAIFNMKTRLKYLKQMAIVNVEWNAP